MDIFDRQSAEDPVDIEPFQGEEMKLIQPTSLRDPKLEKLKGVLADWINSTLKPDHIVVQSLEEDLFDGLVLHHLVARLAGVHLPVDEIALTGAAQTHKLELVMEELNARLGLGDGDPVRWSVKLIHKKDLLATIHLLVAMVRRFQPDLALPPNVKVEVVLVEVSKSGIKSNMQNEYLTEEESCSSTDSLKASSGGDAIEQLLKLDVHKVDIVKKAILHFVNQNMSTMGLQVADLDQFSDGVILLLLIGQLEGFFVPLHDFHLTPVTHTEMLHNVSLALDLLAEMGLHVTSIDPQDIVSQDFIATLKVLYMLFNKHKGR